MNLFLLGCDDSYHSARYLMSLPRSYRTSCLPHTLHIYLSWPWSSKYGHNLLAAETQCKYGRELSSRA